MGDGLPERHRAHHEDVHPTPIYETLTHGARRAVAVALARPFRPGVLFAFYLVLAGLERFLVEFVRRNDRTARAHRPIHRGENLDPGSYAP